MKETIRLIWCHEHWQKLDNEQYWLPVGAKWESASKSRKMCSCSRASHSWLFPRMAAVIHHAGPGTTAAGLSAGIPNATVPHFGSHHFYAKCIADLGAGPKPVDRKKLSFERLSQAIKTATNDQSIKDRANAIGVQIRAEDGVTQAIQAIRQYING